ncbi:MAG: TnpV protein [Oscillospiraceae bacterium]|jgi:hypothetical protein|nr:TnpV protein [Oscillospiraceae bacterium]
MQNIIYTQVGDYLLPNIITVRQFSLSNESLGKYGRMRQSYLKNHRSIHYNTLLLKEQLFPHLQKVDEEANRQLESFMTEHLKSNPPPDKSIDNLVWVAHMTETKRKVEEIIFNKIIYV